MILAALLIFVGFSAGAELFPQEKLPPGRKAGPVVNSPEVLPDRRVIFRIAAPGAETVTLQATDISGLPGDGPRFTKGSNGVWESTVGPLEPGAFRYTFMVDGVAVVDPVNPWVSESNNNVWSLVYVPGVNYGQAMWRERLRRCITTPPYSSASGVCTSTLPPDSGCAGRTIRSCICCMVPETATTHGRPLVAQALSWTT